MSWMLQEIHEQPAALARTLAAEWASLERLRRHFARRKFDFVVLAARGTSDNAAQFGRYLLELTTRHAVSLAAPSIHTLYRARLDLCRALVVGISQSGEATDVNRVLESSRRQGAFTIGITNAAQSTLAKVTHEVLLTHAGAERSVAATKTYTSQLLLLYGLARCLGAPFRPAHLERLPDLTAAALRTEPQAASLAKRYARMQQCAVVSRGLNYANAFELGLKLMETCYVVAERLSAADLLHGPVALIKPSFRVILFVAPGVTRPGLLELASTLRKRKADVQLICCRGAQPRGVPALVVPARIPELWTPIPYIIPGQLLAARLAEVKRLDPDAPRFLKKVTQTL